MPDPINIKQGEARQQPGPEPVARAPERPEQQTLSRLTRIQAGAEIVLAVLALLTACYVAKLILVVILVSILLAFVLAPLVDLFARIRLPRSVGGLLAVVLLLAVTGGLLYVSYNKATDFLQDLPRYSGQIRRMVGRMRQSTERIQRATESVTGQKANSQAQSRPPGLNWSSLVSENLGSVTEVILTASFIPFLVYFMLSWQEHVRSASVKLFRVENRNTAYVTLGMISLMIRSYIVGNFLVGLFMGGVSTVIFGVLHLPYFYFLGFLAGFLNLVPYLGVLLAPVVPLVAGVGQISSTAAVVVVISQIVLHLFSLNVLYPKFLGSRLQLNPLAVTLSLLFWGWLWGAMGLILAVPITAGAKIIFDHIASLRGYGEWLGE